MRLQIIHMMPLENMETIKSNLFKKAIRFKP